MPVDFDNKFIFVHIPKTAGTSISSILKLQGKRHLHDPTIEGLVTIDTISYADQHLTCSLLKKDPRVKNCFDSFFKFTFVRNPYDRFFSTFFWNRSYWKTNENTIEVFNKWVDDFKPNTKKDHFLEQNKFIYDDNGKLMVDFVGKVENIENDFKTITNMIGLNINNTLPKYNITENKTKYNKDDFLTTANKQKIYELFKKDFEIFEYKK